jgi:hypothetical protein
MRERRVKARVRDLAIVGVGKRPMNDFECADVDVDFDFDFDFDEFDEGCDHCDAESPAQWPSLVLGRTNWPCDLMMEAKVDDMVPEIGDSYSAASDSDNWSMVTTSEWMSDGELVANIDVLCITSDDRDFTRESW